MPFNGMTVALHTQTDQLLKNESTRQLIREHYLYTRPLEIARGQAARCRNWRC
jgi:hypothetical protein